MNRRKPSVCLIRGSRGEGGDRGPDPPPPPRNLSEVGYCVDVWLVGEGVQMLFLSYYYNFFLARFVRQYYRKSKCLKNSNHFQVPSPFSQIVIHAISGFYESAFSCLFLSKITRFNTIHTKMFWGRTPRPPPSVPEIAQTFTVLKQLCRMCLGWGENTEEVIYMNSFVSKAVSMATLDFNPTNPE